MSWTWWRYRYSCSWIFGWLTNWNKNDM